MVAPWLVLAGLLTSSSPVTLWQELDARRARGQIDEDTQQFLRVAAVKDPALLPADLRGLPMGGPRRPHGTAVMVDAFQYVQRAHAYGGRVHQLLVPVADLAHTKDSATLPIRVSWSDASLGAMASQVLGAAEHSWTVESADYGFTPPLIEPDAERYRIFIGDTGMGGGAYTAPYGEDPGTRAADCYTYIMFDERNPAFLVPSTVAHEINHAMQAAMDCTEVSTFWENTASYIMAQVYPEARRELQYGFIPAFQGQPWLALDYMNPGGSDGYEYGGVVFPMFLTSTYAPGSGPVFMREVWQAASLQASGRNPNYFEAVNQVAYDYGGPGDFESLFVDLAEARYFMGDDDDGDHVQGAGEYSGCEVALSATLSSSQLPIVDSPGPSGQKPAPYGVNYVKVNLNPNFGRGLRVAFNGDMSTRWAVRALLVGTNLPTQRLEMSVDSDGTGTLDVIPGAYRTVVLLFANLGLPTYSPTRRNWPTTEYYFGIDTFSPGPVVGAVVPAELPQGAQQALLEITGSSFVQGDGFGVSFDDPGIAVHSVELVRATSIKLKVNVGDSAAPGAHSVTVTNEGGAAATGAGLLKIIAAGSADAGAAPADGDGDSGDGNSLPSGPSCASSGGSAAAWPVLAALLLAAWRRRR